MSILVFCTKLMLVYQFYFQRYFFPNKRMEAAERKFKMLSFRHGSRPHHLPAHTYAAFSPFTTFRVSASFPRAAPANGGAAVYGGPRGRMESQLRAY